ncbi:MAG: HD domain-containing protein [Candidatus Saccharimonadales bacterium]
MINYTQRLDSAVRKAAWAHEQAKQHRKGSDVPYIIHPVGTMIIASGATDDEDTLIACLMHDVLEDVSANIYSESDMKQQFGENVVKIVKDVTKNDGIADWHDRSRAYLNHIEHEACDEAVIVSASDKIHNLLSVIADYEVSGDKLWDIFATKSSADQLWWYESILAVITARNVPTILSSRLAEQIETLKSMIKKSA